MSRLEAFCQRVLEAEGRPCSDNPRALAEQFREFFGLEGTPGLSRVLDLMSSLGVMLEEVQYLETGAVNMWKDGWHVHFAFKDPPGTQKFDLLHEAYEIVDKTFSKMLSSYPGIKEPALSRNADRFAAAVLMPPKFISGKMEESGCDPVLLGEELELSHQALLISFAERLQDTPFVAAVYDYMPLEDSKGFCLDDLSATMVIRSPAARYVRRLCACQGVGAKGAVAKVGSLVCLAARSGRPVLCRPDEAHEAPGAPVVLVRPIPWRNRAPGRVLLLAVPDDECTLLRPQVETLGHAPLLAPAHALLACQFQEGFTGCNDNCRWDKRRSDTMESDYEED